MACFEQLGNDFTLLFITPLSTLSPFLSIFCVCTVTFPFLFFLFFFVLVLSSSLCVFVCIGYDGWYLPGAVHGDELPERRPGSRSPRPRWPASQGPRCPPCRSTQVRKCTQTHTISHDSCCITEYVCMYAHTYIFIVVVSLSMIWNAWGPLRPSRLPGSICRQKPKFDTTS